MPRIECQRCKRPERYCYCSNLTEERGSVDIIILQHPKEVRHPMNTARIAELGLTNCTLFTGEDFSHNQELLRTINNRNCFLLFPGPDSINSKEQIARQKPEVVIILDGTWKKARRIYYCNPFLQTLPALFIEHDQQSSYRIRKTPDQSSLSTIEAAVILLRQVDNDNSSHQPLLDAFDRMIQMQIDTMGPELYRKNYAHRLQRNQQHQ